MEVNSTQFKYLNSIVTVTGDYKYPFKCVRRIIILPIQESASYRSMTAMFALFAKMNVNPPASTITSDQGRNKINIWADGTIPYDTSIEINLKDGINGTFLGAFRHPLNDNIDVSMWAAGNSFDDAISYLLGSGQPENNPSTINVTANSSDGLQYIYPIATRWKDGVAIFKPRPLNKLIINSEGIIETKFTITSNYKDSNNISRICYGALTAAPYHKEDKSLLIPMPTIVYHEPLSGIMYIEGEFIKDGICSPNIIVESYWKNEPIRKKLKINEGTIDEKEINCPLPQIIFKFANTTSETRYMELESYVVNSSYERTSIYPIPIGHEIKEDAHTHACTVDDLGYGNTTSTISVANSVAIDHYHDISNFMALESMSHTHKVQCVAINKIKPTTDENINININAYIPYDPTNATPFVYPSDYPRLNQINRIVKLYLENFIPEDQEFPTKPILKIEMSSSNGHGEYMSSGMMNYLVTQTPYDTPKGFDIIAEAYFSEYLYEDSPGHFIIIPERKVDDGTRITIENTWLIPDEEKETTNSISPDKGLNVNVNGDTAAISMGGSTPSATYVELGNKTRKYLLLHSSGYVSSEGQRAKAEVGLRINSDLQWIPDVSEMVSAPTIRKEYIMNALNSASSSKTYSIGPSQIYDGIVLAANRMIDFKYNNSNSNSYTKLIILETDGDENLSQSSLSKASTIVNSIDGENNVPIISIITGDASVIDKILVSKLSNNTGGMVELLKGLSENGILEVIKGIFKSNSLSFNEGIFRVIEEVEAGIPLEFSLENVTVPTNSNIQYRYRTSIDGNNWTEYSGWINYDVKTILPESINNLSKYYEYEIKLRANELFQSPYLKEGIKITHLPPKNNIIFFNQNNVNQSSLEYMASVLITHSGLIPETSKISYGLSQSTSIDPNDYTIAGNDLAPDKQEILLSRYNEVLITNNYKTYMAINGRWAKDANVNVYKYRSSNSINGELVDKTTYSMNYENGTIDFMTQQNSFDEFLICIELIPIYKLICKVTNYGKIPAKINHIGLIYNVAKRIPQLNNGTIVNRSIKNVL